MSTAGAEPGVQQSAKPYPAPAGWEFDVVLADGAIAHVRPIEPSDAGALVAFHSRLSDKTVYLRFFGYHPQLSTAEVSRFTDLDYSDRMALVALLDDQLVSVVRYFRSSDDPSEAEVALVVADAEQRRGIATLLLEHLAAYARTQGISKFSAEVLASNQRMLGVFQRVGYEVQSILSGGVVRVAFPITPTETSIAAMEAREVLAEFRSVQQLLCPQTIAVVGLGHEPGSGGRRILDNLRTGGFNGRVLQVRGVADGAGDEQSYSSVRDIPTAIGLAVITVPPPELATVLEDCTALHVPAAVVITDSLARRRGYSADNERTIFLRARQRGMRIVGPSSVGIANTASDVRMNALSGPVAIRPGRIGVLSQSGALGLALLGQAHHLGLGISSFVSVGEKADVSGNDMLRYWEKDNQTDLILLYLESFGNPRKFARIAKRVSRSKPILAVKGGRTAAGAQVTAHHPRSSVGSEVSADVLFNQAGVVRVDTLRELTQVAAILQSQPLPAGRRLAIVGNSGGLGVTAKDSCATAGLDVATLTAHTRGLLQEIMPTGASVENPVDLAPDSPASEVIRAIDLLVRDTNVDAVIAILGSSSSLTARDKRQMLADVAHRADKPVVACMLPDAGLVQDFAGPLDPEGAVEQSQAAVPVFSFPEEAASALGHVVRYAEWRARPAGVVPRLNGVDSERAGSLVDRFLAERAAGGWLGLEEGARLASLYGIPVAVRRYLSTADHAVQSAEAIGYPVVLRAIPTDPSERWSGEKTGLVSSEQVRSAYVELLDHAPSSAAPILVQAEPGPGLDLVIELSHDSSFGPVVSFGVAGLSRQLSVDRSARTLPITDLDAAELVRSVRAALLLGDVGRPQLDVSALEELALRIGTLGSDLPEVAEMAIDIIPRPVSAEALVVRARLVPATGDLDPMLRRLR